MIGSENEQRLLQESLVLEKPAKAAHNLVDVSKFCVITGASKAGAIPGREVVGSMQVVQMKKNKKWSRRVLSEPLRGGVCDFFAQTLDVARVPDPFPTQVKSA